MIDRKVNLRYTLRIVRSCDYCASQEGRHYCLLHTIFVKNMDIKRCKDWTERVFTSQDDEIEVVK